MRFDYFAIGNHLFLVGSLAYLIGDSIRAFHAGIVETPDASTFPEVNILFFLLSILFIVDACIYMKAFLLSIKRDSDSSIIDTIDSVQSHKLNKHSYFSIWKASLTTRIGWAYTLNLVGSSGYFLTASLPLFAEAATSDDSALLDLDKSQIIIDIINNLIFSLDSLLFLYLCIRDMRSYSTHSNVSAPHTDNSLTSTGSINWDWFNPAMGYFYANITNVIASWGYLIFNIWALDARIKLERAAFHSNSVYTTNNIALQFDYYRSELHYITIKQRTMFFIADLFYLLCSITLEWARYNTAGKTLIMLGNINTNSIQQSIIRETLENRLNKLNSPHIESDTIITDHNNPDSTEMMTVRLPVSQIQSDDTAI